MLMLQTPCCQAFWKPRLRITRQFTMTPFRVKQKRNSKPKYLCEKDRNENIPKNDNLEKIAIKNQRLLISKNNGGRNISIKLCRCFLYANNWTLQNLNERAAAYALIFNIAQQIRSNSDILFTDHPSSSRTFDKPIL